MGRKMKFVIAVAQPADGPRILRDMGNLEEALKASDEVKKLTGAKIELSGLP